VRCGEDLEEHVVDIGQGLDACAAAKLVQSRLAQAGDQTRGRPPCIVDRHTEPGIGVTIEDGDDDDDGRLGGNLVVYGCIRWKR
jgi:hypothetical protein